MMQESFVYEPTGGRILFGADSLQKLPEQAARLGLDRLLVLTTPQQAARGQQILALLNTRGVGLFSGARMHTPVEVTEQAMAIVAERRADGIVAVGGGSTIGLGKAIALRTDLAQIVIPTTYAGSEVTPILGETRGALKTTQRSLKVLPEVVIYDVRLTLSLPVSLSIASGLNAIAHAAEALYAQDRNPMTSIMAEEAVRALVSALPRIAKDPNSEDARSDALYGAWLCGTCLGTVGMALHHKLCHTLGGAFNLPHAETHSVILPHALAYNLSAASHARATLSRAIGAPDPASAMHKLAIALGAPTSLRQLGMPEPGIDHAADLAIKSPYWNPKPVEREAVRNLITRAWAGAAPEAF
ncbi:MAG TPA: maleylacetate reductase [Steroidobacteraceae bacterium]|nr:maleylacetate reductase [Steroidobacteraceae bacterium]